MNKSKNPFINTPWYAKASRWFIQLANNRLMLNAGYLFGTNVIGSVIGLVFWTAAARFYSTEYVGLASSVISSVQLMASLSSLGLGMGLIRYLSSEEKPYGLLIFVLFVTGLMSIVVGLGYNLGVDALDLSIGRFLATPGYRVGLTAFVFLITYSLVIKDAFVGLRRTEYGFWQDMIMHVLRVVLVILLIRWEKIGILGAAFLGILVSVLFGYFAFLPKIMGRWQAAKINFKVPVSELISFSLGNFTSRFLYTSSWFVAPILAFELIGEEASAHTYIAWMLGMFLIGPGMALSLSAFAEGSYDSSELFGVLRKAGKTALIVTTLLCIGGLVGAEKIMMVFGEGYAREGADLFRWFAWAGPLSVLSNIYFTLLKVRNYLKELVILSTIVALISIGLPVIEAGKWGISAFGVGWLLSQLFVVVWVFIRWRLKLLNRLLTGKAKN